MTSGVLQQDDMDGVMNGKAWFQQHTPIHPRPNSQNMSDALSLVHTLNTHNQNTL